ncbi:hypothetical protein L207DRAFT_588965 [Hyaloscypha variabilis F]|uniref:2EXR domain-containing protein n=1 Tax=Hyaloscypha variabilis (strain UAMH 11265 / GT02V1 / F) TaxID=1149755 RepID=A0A2J6R784_HYAVF|nr:hypothetical protein L207DRAFT_588965 [Hyaloscypha variabilis F]
MRRTTGFPQFSFLPPELRLIVWEFAIPDPRVIRYSSLSDIECRHLARSTIYSLEQTLPGILHACYDSRREALKRYRLAFAIELGKPLYFDFERDTLEFGDFNALEAFSKRNTKFNGSMMEADFVRTLAITLTPRLDRDHFKLICSNFARLEELNIREKNTDWINQGYWWNGSTGSPGRWIRELPPLKVIESKDIATYQPLMGLLATIRWFIEARVGELKVWRPPRVVMGSEKQWEEEQERRGRIQIEEDGMDLDQASDRK